MLIKIRDAVQADCDMLCEGNAIMAMETEDHKLPAAILRKGVLALLNDPAKGQYFIAEADGRPAGQLMITHEWSDWRNGDIWWIQSVYVWPEFRRKGVFSALYDDTRREAREASNVCGIRLYVMDDNERAQETYMKCGMQRTNYKLMEEIW